MPWVGKTLQTKAACKAARALLVVQLHPSEVLAALQAAWRFAVWLTQGIGLRPQPWAMISRPVGPGFVSDF